MSDGRTHYYGDGCNPPHPEREMMLADLCPHLSVTRVTDGYQCNYCQQTMEVSVAPALDRHTFSFNLNVKVQSTTEMEEVPTSEQVKSVVKEMLEEGGGFGGTFYVLIDEDNPDLDDNEVEYEAVEIEVT